MMRCDVEKEASRSGVSVQHAYTHKHMQGASDISCESASRCQTTSQADGQSGSRAVPALHQTGAHPGTRHCE